MNSELNSKSGSNTSIISSVTFRGLFSLLILLLCSDLLKEKILRTPFAKVGEIYTISMKIPSQSEKHFDGLKQDEIVMIKLMANMIVKNVIRTT
jgi:hypothetical protein